MAQCDIQTLLNDAECFAGLNSDLRMAAIAALWCQVSEGLGTVTSENPALQSVDDGLWYKFNIVETSPGKAIASPGQIPVPPDVNPSLAITDSGDGNRYVIEFHGTPPNVFWQINGTTLAPETPTTLFAGSNGYTLSVVDGGETIDLTPAP